MVAVMLVALHLVLSAEPLPAGAVMRLGETRFRADGSIHQLRYSADGRAILGWIVGDDGTKRSVAWDSGNGTRLKDHHSGEPPDLPENAVSAVRLEGNRILTAGPGRAGIVWDADNRRELARLGGHVGQVRAVAASPDGKRLATGDTAGLLRLWDAESYHPLPVPCGHNGMVREVQFSADSQRVLTYGDDRTARVWDLSTGRELRAFPTETQVDLNAAGTGVIVRAGGTTIIRDVITGLEMIPPEQTGRSKTVFPARHDAVRSASGESPTGRFRAQPRADGAIELRETATDEVRRVLVGERVAVRILGFTSDGTRFLTACGDHTVLVWDVRLQATPLFDAIRQETRAAKLWAMMCTGKADEAYQAMARFAAEPAAAVKMARLRLKPARSSDAESAGTRLADSRALELLEAIDTAESRTLVQELAEGDAFAWRTLEARRAVERTKKK